jgi:hypothetical protein
LLTGESISRGDLFYLRPIYHHRTVKATFAPCHPKPRASNVISTCAIDLPASSAKDDSPFVANDGGVATHSALMVTRDCPYFNGSREIWFDKESEGQRAAALLFMLRETAGRPLSGLSR